MVSKIRIAVVEDHPLMLQAVRQQLEVQPDFTLVLMLAHGSELLPAMRQKPVDIVILDLGMDTGLFDPVSTVQQLRMRYPGVVILVLSSLVFGEKTLGVLEAGVHGYLTKSDLVSMDLAKVLRRLLSGDRVFSHAIDDLRLSMLDVRSPARALFCREERQMLHLAAQGHTNKEIAFMLGYSEKTVRNRFTPIFRKLGAANRVDAIRKAQVMGFLQSQYDE